jgi:drug/metabolite transporter (DMT)-like permease
MQQQPGLEHDNASQMIKGNALIFISTLFFGLNIPALKILIPEWMSAVDVTVARFMGAAILMWITSLFVKNEPIAKNDRWRIFLCGGVALFAFIYLFSLSLKFASPIDVSIILTTPPIIVTALSVIIYKERVSKLEILGIAISFAGAIAVILSQGSSAKGSDNLLGDLIAFAACICYAIYLLGITGPTKRYSPVNLTRWVLLSASIVAIPFAFSFPESKLVTDPQFEPIALIAFVVVFPTYVAYLTVAPAIKLIGSELVSMYQYLVPVIATIACVIMKLDTLHWTQPVAIVIILAGVWITNVGKHSRSTGTPAK